MLGLLRFVLALFVVAAHLTGGMAFFSHWGAFAVFGFYIISGYLISMILNEVYAFQISAFALNRVLRLFPIYYMTAAITMVAILSLSRAGEFHPAWTIRTHWQDVVGNLFIIPFEFYEATFRLVPPTWSVAVELINYSILWAVGARSKMWALLLFLGAAAYHGISYLAGANWGQRYSPFYAALLPFAVGALIYFFRKPVRVVDRQTVRRVRWIALTAWIGNLLLCGALGGLGHGKYELFFYANLIFLAVFLYAHILLHGTSAGSRWDKRFGDLAYPIFLTHWVIAFVMGQLLLGGQQRGLALLALSLPPILVVSYALAKLADHLIEPLRDKVRHRSHIREAKVAP